MPEKGDIAMKKSWVIVLVIAIVIVCVGAWFGLNIYAQQKAKKEITAFLRKNNLEKSVTYGSVKAGFLSNSVSVDRVKYMVENNFTGERSGYFTIDRVVFSGSPEGSYCVMEYGIKYFNQNPKLKGLVGKMLFSIDELRLKVEKEDNKKLESKGFMENLRLNMPVIISALGEKKNRPLFKIVDFDSPIDAKVEYGVNFLKRTLKIDEYSIDFENNLKVSYSCKLRNIDFKRLETDVKALRSSGGIVKLSDLLDTLSSVNVQEIKFEVKNRGLVDRVFGFISNETHRKRSDIVNGFVHNLVVEYPGIFRANSEPLRRFLMSRENEVEVELKANSPVSLKELVGELDSMPLYKVIEKDFTISFEN